MVSGVQAPERKDGVLDSMQGVRVQVERQDGSEQEQALSGLLLQRRNRLPFGPGRPDQRRRRAARRRVRGAQVQFVAPYRHHQPLEIDKRARSAIKGQKPVALWFTGLSGAGKSTIANLVEKRLHAMGRHTYTLDGDTIRRGLNRDLGFSEAERAENIRRASEVAALFVDAGIITLVSFISPCRAERASARERFGPDEFAEVFVDTPIEECRRRDPKGHYSRADAGEIPNFTGVSAPYEPPLCPDLHLRTTQASPEQLAASVISWLSSHGHIP